MSKLYAGLLVIASMLALSGLGLFGLVLITNLIYLLDMNDWGLIVPTWVLAVMAMAANGLTFWLVISSNKANQLEFRAYIVGVALFGVPKGPKGPREQYRPKASDYTGPWRLHIHNFGRTPGVILKVEWGKCP